MLLSATTDAAQYMSLAILRPWVLLKKKVKMGLELDRPKYRRLYLLLTSVSGKLSLLLPLGLGLGLASTAMRKHFVTFRHVYTLTLVSNRSEF